MKSISSTLAISSIALLAPAMADMAGQTINAYNSPGCSEANYYIPFDVGSGYPSCTTNDFSDPNFNQTSGGGYSIYFGVPQPDEGCKYFIRAPADVSNPGCGDVIGSFSNAICYLVDLQPPFDLNFCCGDSDCANAINPTKKRALPFGELANVTEGLTKTTKTKRDSIPSGCSWAAASETYTVPGSVDQVTATAACNDPNGCTISQSYAAGTSSTNTFNVEESTKIDLFDIVEETVTFGYSYAYTTSETDTVQISYTVPSGGNGYITFTPTLVCSDGAFNGCESLDSGLTGSGTVCVPRKLNNGQMLDGTINFVEAN